MVNGLVSVVILNYNTGALLVECVESVLSSSMPVKIYISDNASTDDSLLWFNERFKDHDAIVVKKNPTNLGFAAGNNAVYPFIDTPFILYLNPDCLLKENTIECLVSVLQSSPEAAVVGCLIKNPDGSEQVGCRGLTPTPRRVLNQAFKLNQLFPGRKSFSGYLLSDKPLPQQQIPVELISGSCMLVRKQAIDEVGLLDEGYFLYCEDYDWFYRFIHHHWKIIFTPRTDVIHIKGFSAKKRPLKALWWKTKGMWRYYDKFFKKDSNFLSVFIIRLGIVFRFLILSVFELFKYPLSKVN